MPEGEYVNFHEIILKMDTKIYIMILKWIHQINEPHINHGIHWNQRTTRFLLLLFVNCDKTQSKMLHNNNNLIELTFLKYFPSN